LAALLKRILRGAVSALVAVWVLLVAAPALAADGKVRDLVVRVADGEAHVTARLEGGFPKKVVRQIRSGVPQDLFYTVTLRRRHRRWFDEELVARTVRYTVKFDTLRSRYQIRRTGPDGEITENEATTYAEAVAALSVLDRVAVPLPETGSDYTHYVTVKAEMRATALPLYLDYVFFFVPRLEYETPWARSGPVSR